MKTTNANHKTKTAKRERRARRGADGRSKRIREDGPAWSGGPIGVRMFDPSAPWPEIAPTLLPLLKRVHQAYPPQAAPVHLRVPPGIWTGFGIDLGPAWAHVTRDLVDRWGVGEAEILGAALDNLRRRVADEPPRVERANFAGAAATVVQAQGWGSALVLAPDRLADLIGDAPATLLMPVRNALIALPEDLDVDLAVAIWEAFAEGSNDELDVEPLRWTGSVVVAVEGGPGGHIH